MATITIKYSDWLGFVELRNSISAKYNEDRAANSDLLPFLLGSGKIIARVNGAIE